MLRFLLILLMIYLFFRFGKVLLRWYIKNKLDGIRRPEVKKQNEKFIDADDAKFTDIIDPEKKNKKNE